MPKRRNEEEEDTEMIVSSKKQMKDFKLGLRKGIPIALGYLSVSFTFGVKAVNAGIPAWIVVLISLTNLTSAGQFAGTNLMVQQCAYVEIAITTFVINIRYMLMSLALSQKIKKDTKVWKRLIFGFGITDEVFGVSISEPGKISASYMNGLITLPIVGWTLGTALGTVASHWMPEVLSQAMELGLYAMFIAIIVPPARKSKPITMVILLAVLIECILYYVPIFQFVSDGFKVIIATVFAAGIGALVCPINQGEQEYE